LANQKKKDFGRGARAPNAPLATALDLLTNGQRLERETNGREYENRKNYAFGHIMEDHLH